MSRAWGTPPWRVELQFPRADLPARVQVAVVGAGFTGLAAALAVAEAGGRVAVLEAAHVGAGASGRTGGMVLEGLATGSAPGAESCIATLAALVEKHAIACDLDLPGALEVAHAASAPPGERSWPDLEDTRIVASARVPGGAVDPGALVAGLARAVIAAGGTIHPHTRVTRIEAGARPRLTLATRAAETVLEADRVVLALDGFLPGLVPDASSRAALTLAVATEPLPQATLEEVGLGATPFYTVDLPYLWGRATRAGRLVIGAGLVFDPGNDVERIDLGHPDAQAGLARVERRLRGLHPLLAGVAITHRWGGPVGFRSARTPVLAETAPGVLACGAYAGHGVALSARVGEIAAAWALTRAALPAWGAT
jgi:gamma-glutamylputrescine oxidase